jgi:subtilase family serine protease
MRHQLRALACAVGITTTTLGLTGFSMPPGAAQASATSSAVRPVHGPLSVENGRPGVRRSPSQGGGLTLSPPTDAECKSALADEGIRQCFDPSNIRTAYGVDQLISAKDEGRGQTIVIIDSFGSPTIRNDLRTFDRGYKLVGPPSFRVLAPLGTVRFDPDNDTQSGWAAETTLDVEWSHAMAPLARIVLLTSPIAETEGTVGLGDFLELEQYALNHRLGNIITQSWAATENTLETQLGRTLVAKFEDFYARADRQHITVLASAGDTGTQNPSNESGTRSYRQPTVNFPASSPLITSVGGTSVSAVVPEGAASASSLPNRPISGRCRARRNPSSTVTVAYRTSRGTPTLTRRSSSTRRSGAPGARGTRSSAARARERHSGPASSPTSTKPEVTRSASSTPRSTRWPPITVGCFTTS